MTKLFRVKQNPLIPIQINMVKGAVYTASSIIDDKFAMLIGIEHPVPLSVLDDVHPGTVEVTEVTEEIVVTFKVYSKSLVVNMVPTNRVRVGSPAEIVAMNSSRIVPESKSQLATFVIN